MDYSKLNDKTGCILRLKDSDEEVVMISWGSYEFKDDHYTIFNFLKYDIIVEIDTYSTNKSYVKRLIKEGIITEDWEFDLEKIKTFAKKYHKNISQ